MQTGKLNGKEVEMYVKVIERIRERMFETYVTI